MQVVFFGTPAFAVPSLRALLDEGIGVSAVVTQTDKPKGRSRSVFVPPPVKVEAEALGLPVLQPARPTGDLFRASLKRSAPDLGVVVAYGHILPKSVLSVPRLGMINVHASLLPRHRGAGPIQAAILQGDETTGITIMRMDAGMDTGPILHSAETSIGPDETAGQLADRLSALGAKTLVEAIGLIRDGRLHPQPQDPASASYAPKLDRETARIRWDLPAQAISSQIRAFDPTPGAWTRLGGRDLKLFRPTILTERGEAGVILSTAPELIVGAGEGSVSLREVQPAGRRRMLVSEWVRGGGPQPGQRLE
jgi:methionyl-tRNA formyltransferase